MLYTSVWFLATMARAHQTQRKSKFGQEKKPTVRRTRREKVATKAKRRTRKLGLSTRPMINNARLRRIVSNLLHNDISKSTLECFLSTGGRSGDRTYTVKPIRMSRGALASIHSATEYLMSMRLNNAAKVTRLAKRVKVAGPDYQLSNAMNGATVVCDATA